MTPFKTTALFCFWMLLASSSFSVGGENLKVFFDGCRERMPGQIARLEKNIKRLEKTLQEQIKVLEFFRGKTLKTLGDIATINSLIEEIKALKLKIEETEKIVLRMKELLSYLQWNHNLLYNSQKGKLWDYFYGGKTNPDFFEKETLKILAALNGFKIDPSFKDRPQILIYETEAEEGSLRVCKDYPDILKQFAVRWIFRDWRKGGIFQLPSPSILYATLNNQFTSPNESIPLIDDELSSYDHQRQLVLLILDRYVNLPETSAESELPIRFICEGITENVIATLNKRKLDTVWNKVLQNLEKKQKIKDHFAKIIQEHPEPESHSKALIDFRRESGLFVSWILSLPSGNTFLHQFLDTRVKKMSTPEDLEGIFNDMIRRHQAVNGLPGTGLAAYYQWRDNKRLLLEKADPDGGN